jgi:hypothetical protein
MFYSGEAILRSIFDIVDRNISFADRMFGLAARALVLGIHGSTACCLPAVFGRNVQRAIPLDMGCIARICVRLLDWAVRLCVNPVPSDGRLRWTWGPLLAFKSRSAAAGLRPDA